MRPFVEAKCLFPHGIIQDITMVVTMPLRALRKLERAVERL